MAFGGVEGAAQLGNRAMVVSRSIHKNIPSPKVTRAFSPLLESSSIRSWAAGEVTLRTVPRGQLLLPHRKPFTPQLISKLTNYSTSLAGKHPFPFTGCLEGYGQHKTASNAEI